MHRVENDIRAYQEGYKMDFSLKRMILIPSYLMKVPIEPCKYRIDCPHRKYIMEVAYNEIGIM